MKSCIETDALLLTQSIKTLFWTVDIEQHSSDKLSISGAAAFWIKSSQFKMRENCLYLVLQLLHFQLDPMTKCTPLQENNTHTKHFEKLSKITIFLLLSWALGTLRPIWMLDPSARGARIRSGEVAWGLRRYQRPPAFYTRNQSSDLWMFDSVIKHHPCCRPVAVVVD